MSNSTIVGIVYIVMGTFGITENGLTAVLIATHREMRNPTYVYMVSLCLSDMVELSFLAVYSGIVLVYPSAATFSLTKISCFVTGISFYGSLQSIVLMTFSRYVQLKAAHKMQSYFKHRNMIISILVLWLFPMICFCWVLFYDPTPFKFDANLGKWQFDESQNVGRILEILTMVATAAVALSVNFVNVKTLLHVRRMRQQVHHTIGTRANTKREIKLFAQCAITGTLFTVAVVVYFVASALKDRINTVALVVAHCLWMLNALQHPFIYFALNSLLRERFAATFLCRKQTAAGKSDHRVRTVSVKLSTLYVKEFSGVPPAAPQ